MLGVIKSFGSGYLTVISGIALIVHGLTGWWLETGDNPVQSILEGAGLLGLRRAVKEETKPLKLLARRTYV